MTDQLHSGSFSQLIQSQIFSVGFFSQAFPHKSSVELEE